MDFVTYQFYTCIWNAGSYSHKDCSLALPSNSHVLPGAMRAIVPTGMLHLAYYWLPGPNRLEGCQLSMPLRGSGTTSSDSSSYRRSLAPFTRAVCTWSNKETLLYFSLSHCCIFATLMVHLYCTNLSAAVEYRHCTPFQHGYTQQCKQ